MALVRSVEGRSAAIRWRPRERGLTLHTMYYPNEVRSVPEYLRRRFNDQAHLLNAATFALSQVLIAGVNLSADTRALMRAWGTERGLRAPAFELRPATLVP